LTTIKTLTPFSNLPFGIHIVAMAASETNVVMLGSDDVAYATGGNSFGQLGQGATDDDPHSTPTALPVSDVVGIASTSSAIGLIRKSGTVVAAGDNTYTPLTGTTQPVVRFQPLAMSATVPATGTGAELVLDSVTAIVRDSLGIVYGAGDNTYGQLTGTVPSDPSLVVLGGQKVLNTGTPTVTGTVKVGRTLTAHVGSWEVSATRYSYQWLRNGAAIHAATKATYKLVRADKRKKISVRVTGARTGFTTGTATSAGRGPVAKAKR
jgi:alpha-tubulin suppressor-like RCC1 family protein